MRANNYEVEILGINYDEINKIKEIKADMVFNLIEWSGINTKYAVEAIKALDNLKIAYTGSDGLGYELSSNKLLMKKAMEANSIPTPNWQAFLSSDTKGVIKEFRYPVIVKPILEHCGIGISQKSVCEDEVMLRMKLGELLTEYPDGLLVEELIIGKELHVTILEKYGRPWVLPPAEIAFVKKEGHWPILTYDAKWKEDSSEYQMSDIFLAKLDEKLQRRVEEIATSCYQKLGGRDYPRLDLRTRGDQIWVLEINNNPGIGFDTESGIGISGRAVGFDYPHLIKHIVENAMKRFKT
jgi:D-alanine-D-alanine ligase